MYVVFPNPSAVTLSPKLRCCSEGPPGPLGPEKPRSVGAALPEEDDARLDALDVGNKASGLGFAVVTRVVVCVCVALSREVTVVAEFAVLGNSEVDEYVDTFAPCHPTAAQFPSGIACR